MEGFTLFKENNVRCLSWFFTVGFLLSSLQAQGQEPPVFTDTIEIRSVVIAANVFNPKGRPYLYLRKEDFSLYEGEVLQEIDFFKRHDRAAIKIAFLLDESGSMALGQKMRFSKRAIEVAVSLLQRKDQYALYTFSEGKVVCRLPFSSNKQAVSKALVPVEAYGKTALMDAVYEMPQILQADTRGKKAIVLFTDGLDNASTFNKLDVFNQIKRVNIPIYVVAFDTLASKRDSQFFVDAGLSTKVLHYFSAQTGGMCYIFEDPVKAPGALVEIYKTLSHQYLLGYTAKNKRKGQYVRIKLKINGRDAKVVCRKGILF